MNVLTVPSRVLDQSLRILRLPLDLTVGVLDGEGDKASAFTLGVDRADAKIRHLAGRILHDEQLQRDAQARDLAIDERAKALQLRSEAELGRERADAEYSDDLASAQELRIAAEQRAEQQRTKVDAQRRAESERLAKQTDQRRTTSRKVADRTQQAIDERAKAARLADLENEAEVLETREVSVTTRSEAQRLQSAASKTKNKRKSG